MLERNTEKLIVGAALAFAASTLWPIVKNTLKPLAETGMQGAAGLTDRIQYALQVVRDEIEDIVAEAQFERMRKQLDRDIAAEFASFEETGDLPHAESND
jgi:PHD/YefM family antitoxin component YafN of YafNO toxin-antitoxin module